MFTTFLLLFVSIFFGTAHGVAPTFLRTPDALSIPYEEIMMQPPNGQCNGFTACMAVTNWSPTWMAVDVPEYGTSNKNTNRVFTDGAIFTGIYLGEYPVYGGLVEVVLDNQRISVPVVIGGNFISAIAPCKVTGAVPKGYLRVSPGVQTINLMGHTVIVTGSDASLTLAYDEVKGVLVRAPLEAYGTMSGVYSAKRHLYDANGTPVAYGRPFEDTILGPRLCRDNM